MLSVHINYNLFFLTLDLGVAPLLSPPPVQVLGAAAFSNSWLRFFFALEEAGIRGVDWIGMVPKS